jgi:DnaJ-class molecular chaperone
MSTGKGIDRLQARQTESLYELLGVSRYATRETIQEAYREIARLYHPDSTFYSEIIEDPARERHLNYFHRATEAYQILSDVSARKEYDRQLGPELQEWEVDKERDPVFTPLNQKGFQRSAPVLSDRKNVWFCRTRSMNDIIARHHGRTKRRLMKFALAAPFVFIVLLCLVLAALR